jgi:hypothetical protein
LKELVNSEVAEKALNTPPQLPNPEIKDAEDINKYLKHSSSVMKSVKNALHNAIDD